MRAVGLDSVDLSEVWVFPSWCQGHRRGRIDMAANYWPGSGLS